MHTRIAKHIATVLAVYCALYVGVRACHGIVHNRVIHSPTSGTHYLDGPFTTFFAPLGVLELAFWYSVDPISSGMPKFWRIADGNNGFL